MKILKLALVAMVATFSLTTTAQSVDYKVLVDNTEDMKNLAVYLDLFYGEAWQGDRMNIGYKFGTFWNVNSRIGVDFSLQKPYGEGGDMSYRDAAIFAPAHNAEFDDLKKLGVLNLVGSFALVSKDVRKPVKVVLASSSGGGWTSTTFIEPEANVRTRFGVRGGMLRYNSTVLFGSDSDTYPAVITDDGTMLHIYGANDAEGNEIFYSTNTLSWAATQRAMCVVGGLEYTTQANITLDAGGYGERSNSTIKQFYADVLFAPAPQIDDVHWGELEFDITGNDETALKTSNLGWRFGFRMLHAKKLINWGWATELGSRPGLEGQGLYLNWSLTLPVVAIKVPSLG